MNTLHSIAQVRAAIARAREEGKRIGLVPTMGNLHQGHLALVEKALQRTDCVIVSIFVNPLQFGPNEDLDSYPRTLAEDQHKLLETGANMVFAPSASEIYPQGMQGHTRINVPLVSDGLCGASRPGHFEGVATVVAKLFNIIQPDLAVFGEKDFQQLAVIRKMTQDLCLPVQILGEPTVRAEDGLALSSRNGYLDQQERALAPELFRSLQWLAEQLPRSHSQQTLVTQAAERIEAAGMRVDYLELRDAETLDTPTPDSRELVILVAAFLGKTRLIDNLRIALG